MFTSLMIKLSANVITDSVTSPEPGPIGWLSSLVVELQGKLSILTAWLSLLGSPSPVSSVLTKMLC